MSVPGWLVISLRSAGALFAALSIFTQDWCSRRLAPGTRRQTTAAGKTGRITWLIKNAMGQAGRTQVWFDLVGDGTLFRQRNDSLDLCFEVFAVQRLPLPERSYYEGCLHSRSSPAWRCHTPRRRGGLAEVVARVPTRLLAILRHLGRRVPTHRATEPSSPKHPPAASTYAPTAAARAARIRVSLMGVQVSRSARRV